LFVCSPVLFSRYYFMVNSCCYVIILIYSSTIPKETTLLRTLLPIFDCVYWLSFEAWVFPCDWIKIGRRKDLLFCKWKYFWVLQLKSKHSLKSMSLLKCHHILTDKYAYHSDRWEIAVSMHPLHTFQSCV